MPVYFAGVSLKYIAKNCITTCNTQFAWNEWELK